MRPHAGRLLGVAGLSLAATGLGLAQPWLTRHLVDEGLLAGDFGTVVGVAGLMVGLAGAAATLGALNRWHYTALSARVLHRLREDVFGHLLRLSPAWHARARAGDLLARLDGDVAEVQRFTVDTALAALNAVIALAGALALMLALSPALTAIALVLLPAEVVFLRRMRPRVEVLTRTVRARTADLSSFLLERLGAVKLVQSVSAEDREREALARLHEGFRADLLRQQMTGYLTAAVPGLMVTASTAATFVAGGWLVVEGRLSVGTLIAFTLYLARSTGPTQTLLGLYVAWQRARVSLERVLEVASAAPAVRPAERPRPLPPGRGEIRLEGVRFRHPGAETDVLDGVDLVIPGGARVAIGGASGEGKSTLVDLLQRHYDPDAGRIRLDGADLRELDLGELRRRVVVVAQDTVLLQGTILDNLRYAAPGASEEAVRAAARRARADVVAAARPLGWEAPIGTRGASLSGGERQRIAIARALLLDPRVLILDEATAAVDRGTEAAIVAAVDELFPDRTRIVVSHRPELLRGADLRLELAGGRLRPAGSDGAAGRAAR